MRLGHLLRAMTDYCMCLGADEVVEDSKAVDFAEADYSWDLVHKDCKRAPLPLQNSSCSSCRHFPACFLARKVLYLWQRLIMLNLAVVLYIA